MAGKFRLYDIVPVIRDVASYFGLDSLVNLTEQIVTGVPESEAYNEINKLYDKAVRALSNSQQGLNMLNSKLSRYRDLASFPSIRDKVQAYTNRLQSEANNLEAKVGVNQALLDAAKQEATDAIYRHKQTYKQTINKFKENIENAKNLQK